MKKIKIAQIGTSRNSHGNQIWNSLLKQNDIFEVVGYAFPEEEREKFPARVTVFDAVMSSIYVPDTVPLKSRFAVIVIDFLPSELCATVTVCLASSVSVSELELLLITFPLNFN